MVNEPGRSRGVDLIADERFRQLAVHDWRHDLEHADGELVTAAICYATPPEDREIGSVSGCPTMWPFEPDTFRSRDRVRDLQKAGALIAAELDRLLGDPARTATPTGGTTVGAGAVCG